MSQLIIQKALEYSSDITTQSTLKRVLKAIGLKTNNIDRLYVELKNNVYRGAYDKVCPKKTIIFLPHCLRDPTCKAKLSREGYLCELCGKCKIAQIRKELEPQGYRIFIVPGISMVINIIKKIRPKAILGVACGKELLLALKHEKDLNIPMQSVRLLRDGCMETDVDVDEVLEVASKN